MSSSAWRWIDRYTTRTAALIVAVTLLLIAAVALASAYRSPTELAPVSAEDRAHFGADFIAFYAAGTQYAEAGPVAVYDTQAHLGAMRRADPGFTGRASSGFIYPPWLAAGFSWFARVPYRTAYAAWLALSLAIFVVAIGLAMRSRAPWIDVVSPSDSASSLPLERSGATITVWLLAISFPPFLYENWLGGQLASLGAFAFALAWMLRSAGRTQWAGAALSLLLYKPTLLLWVLPLLILERAWREVAGFMVGATVLMGLSVLLIGVPAHEAYAERLVAYATTGGSGADLFRTFKFIDLSAALTLLGVPRTVAAPVAVALMAVFAVACVWYGRRVAVAPNAGLWWRTPNAMRWAVAVMATSVIAVYGPVYDLALAVPALVVVHRELVHRAMAHHDPSSSLQPWYRLLAGLLVASLLTSPLAHRFGVQLLTPVLVSVLLWLSRHAVETPTPRRVAN